MWMYSLLFLLAIAAIHRTVYPNSAVLVIVIDSTIPCLEQYISSRFLAFDSWPSVLVVQLRIIYNTILIITYIE